MAKNSLNMLERFIAICKGDEPTLKADKFRKQAYSHLNTQVALLKHELLKRTTAVEDAEEALDLALHNNGELISESSNYCEKLIEAQKKVEKAELDVEAAKKSLAFFEKMLAYSQKTTPGSSGL